MNFKWSVLNAVVLCILILPGSGSANDYYKLMDVAQAYQKNGQINKAIEVYEKAINIKPNNSTGLILLGLAYTKAQMYSKAISVAERVLGAPPTNDNLMMETPAYSILGQSYYALGQYDKSLVSFRKLLFYTSNRPDAYYYIGEIYIKQGRLNDAIEPFEKTVEFAPDFSEARFKLGLLYFISQKKNKGLAQLKALEKLAPALAAKLKSAPEVKRYLP